MKATIVYNDSDWEALYVDGICVQQDHRIDVSEALKSCGIEVEHLRAAEIEDYFPNNLSDVIEESIEDYLNQEELV